MLNKNKIIIIAVAVALVFIFGGIISWGLFQKSKIPSEEEAVKREEIKEIFSISAVVSSVDVQNNFLMVKPVSQEREIKVILSETTKLIKLKVPSGSKTPAPGTTFIPEQKEIKISGFQIGDSVFIKAKENIAGTKFY